MKKVMIVASALLMLGATSCKKSGTCTCGGIFSTTQNDLDKDQYDEAKSDCEALTCVWTDN